MRTFCRTIVAAAWALASAAPLHADDGACTPGSGPRDWGRDIGRDVLADNDGWASTSGGTTGGSAATCNPPGPCNIFTVADRAHLAAALSTSISGPRIIYVQGTINGQVDDANQPVDCSFYVRNGYSLGAYLAAYDPATWGRRVPSGTQELARAASGSAETARIRLEVPSNTTIVGLGADAKLVGVNLRLNRPNTNIIVRNITFEDAFDCFPQWDPTDGAQGNWNSAYDNISITGAQRVWIDHDAFSDGAHPDRTQPLYFGRPFQWHDGECDITNNTSAPATSSDLITVSWNRFTDHDKTMLIGSSDSASAANLDRTHLRVTIHHNLFAGSGQRGPRDRFGQVHVYNNYYEVLNPSSLGVVPSYQYSWGVGVESKIYAENNAVRIRAGGTNVTPDKIIRRFTTSTLQATAIHAIGTQIDGPLPDDAVDVLAAYNAANPSAQLSPDVGWAPTLFTSIDPAANVPALVTCVSGDVTGNGWIECDDLAADASAVGTRSGEPGWSAADDVNGDGVVDVRDLALVSQGLPEGTACPR